jgi:hypothetical protein
VAPFRLARLKESPYVKQGTMVFEMRINSVFLGFFMDPNHLVFDTATRRLLEIHGPTLLKRKKGDEWSMPTPISTTCIKSGVDRVTPR